MVSYQTSNPALTLIQSSSALLPTLLRLALWGVLILYRAVNPFKPPLLSPPQKEWRPSIQGIHSSSISTMKSANTRALLRVLILELSSPFIPSFTLYSFWGGLRSGGLKGITALVLLISTPQSVNTRAVNPLNFGRWAHPSFLLRRAEEWRFEGVQSSSISTHLSDLTLELWIPWTLGRWAQPSFLLRRAEEWRFEGVQSSSISTPLSANTRALNPLNFGKMGLPFIPSEGGWGVEVWRDSEL